jgi:drug/metabolite transporter (DMT)-like permease
LWSVAAAVSGCIGIAAYYQAARIGKFSVVAPIAGVAAAIPVLFAAANGERLSALQASGVACALLGVTLVSFQKTSSTSAAIATGGGFAILAAVGLGFYYPAIHAAARADVLQASVVFRAAMLVLMIAGFLALQRPRTIAWPALPTIALVGVIDAAATVFFSLASTRGSLGLSSVVASLYPLVVVLLAAVILGERLHGPQRIGVVLCFIGIALLAS